VVTTLLEIGLWNAVAAALLALAAAGLGRLCRRPALTHVLWVLVLLKLITPPLVPVALPWSRDREDGMRKIEDGKGREEAVADSASLSASAVSAAPNNSEPVPPGPPENVTAADGSSPAEADPLPAVSSPFSWDSYLVTIWLTGTALWTAWVVFHVSRFRRVLRHARRTPGDLQAEAEGLARRLGLKRCPQVWLVPGAVCPMIWSLGQAPRLLFPSGLLERLDAAGRSALLAHELAHVRRRDHWVRMLELVVTGLYWWHPVVWWARREVHEAEELCCDAWAAWASGGEGRPYALALLQAVAFVSQARLPLPEGASGIGHVSHLKRRLAMILQGKPSRSLSWAGFSLVLGLGLLLLPLFPAQGQTTTAQPQQTKDTRDQQIDALKKAIDVLEQQKKEDAEKLSHRALQPNYVPLTYTQTHYVPVTTTYAKVKEQAETNRKAEDLQADLRKLEDVIAVKKKEVQDLEAKANELRVQLKTMNVSTAASDTRLHTTGTGTWYSKPASLEQKLDRLQKELEELRKELRGNKTPASGSKVP
jgi:beta-lactamase regulating signal transducer with metallopeptidase domain